MGAEWGEGKTYLVFSIFDQDQKWIENRQYISVLWGGGVTEGVTDSSQKVALSA